MIEDIIRETQEKINGMQKDNEQAKVDFKNGDFSKVVESSEKSANYLSTIASSLESNENLESNKELKDIYINTLNLVSNYYKIAHIAARKGAMEEKAGETFGKYSAIQTKLVNLHNN
ncbi:MAG: hypothetical protein WC393_02995 [Candidatus Nanoarchaeia archaeon]